MIELAADPVDEPKALKALALSLHLYGLREFTGGVAGLVGIEGGVVSGVFNLESSGVEAPDWRPRHDERYHKA